MLIKVKLKKVSSSHNNVRTDEVVGVLVSPFPIAIGDRIAIVAEPLDRTKDYREIVTTPVKKIEGDLYYTENSVYEIRPEDPILYGRTIQ